MKPTPTRTIGDMNLLQRLINATPIDLVRIFKARRAGDSYIIPLMNQPWVYSIDLPEKKPLMVNDSVLAIEGVNVRVADNRARAIAGFLGSDGRIYGSYIMGGSGFRCIKVNVNKPHGININIPNVDFEGTEAYVSSYRGVISVPRCSLVGSLYDVYAMGLIFTALNVYAMNSILVEISNIKLLYL